MDAQTPPSMKTTTFVAIKRGLLLYWALWCSVVFATHAVFELKALGLVHFTGMPLLSSSTAIYGTAAGEHGVWSIGALAWEGAAAVAFWMALHKFRGQRSCTATLLAAPFVLAFSMFAVFVVADHLLLNPAHQAMHLRIMAALSVSFLVVFFLPE